MANLLVDLTGQVAFITGAARGQGRAHAAALARAGADIVAVDICEDIPTCHYRLGSPSDLDETARLVGEAGREVLAIKVDVRDRDGLIAAAEDGYQQFGRLDISLANAGIMAAQLPPFELSEQAWHDTIAVNLTGVWNTLQATTPLIQRGGRGGAVVITGSTASQVNFSNFDGGMDGYQASKWGILGLMRAYAARLAQDAIRVNALLPTSVATPMAVNDFVPKWFESSPMLGKRFAHALPTSMMQPDELSQSMLYLVSDAGRYVTGAILPVDMGATTVTFAGGTAHGSA
jgi:SDR family mycofactocin-dependent oxidoreductase